MPTVEERTNSQRAKKFLRDNPNTTDRELKARFNNLSDSAINRHRHTLNILTTRQKAFTERYHGRSPTDPVVRKVGKGLRVNNVVDLPFDQAVDLFIKMAQRAKQADDLEFQLNREKNTHAICRETLDQSRRALKELQDRNMTWRAIQSDDLLKHGD